MNGNTGRAFIFGDNVNTDVLAPGLYMKQAIHEIAPHCLEALDPAFASEVRPDDVVVGGENFGMGSSREQAVMALRHLGVNVVVAISFAGLFFRNAFNLGLTPLICPEASKIKAGDILAIDPEAALVHNRSTGQTYSCDPTPPHLIEMVRDGGLIPHLEKKLTGVTE